MTLYDDLGVSPNASKKDIEKAYRKEAMKHHPDKGGNKEAFQTLTLAYSILKDPERKGRYDKTGETNSPKSEQDDIFRKLLIEGFTRSDNPIKSILNKLKQDKDKGEQARGVLEHKKQTIQNRLNKFLKLNDSEIVKETIEATILQIDSEINNITNSLDMLTRLTKDFEDFKEHQSQANTSIQTTYLFTS